MIDEGFLRGTSSPCEFWNLERELVCVVHVDDFIVLGWESESTGSGLESAPSSSPSTEGD